MMLPNVPTMLLCGLLTAVTFSAAQSNASQALADLSPIEHQPLWDNGTISTDQPSYVNQSSTKVQSTPLVQILAIGYTPKSVSGARVGDQPPIQNKAIEAGCSPITTSSGNTVHTTKTCWNGAHPQPLFEGAPMTITRVDSAPGQTAKTVVETAQAEATLIGSTNDAWRINLSPTFVHEVIRLANEQCHKAGLSKRQYVDPSIMLCMPGQLPPDSLIQLQDAIRRYAYSEISYDDLSTYDWEANKFGVEEVRIEAASIVQLGIMDVLDKSGGYLNGNLVVAPVVAHSWLSSALASRTKPDRYWDFHSRTSSTKITSSSPSSVTAPSKSTSTDEDFSKSISVDDKESKTSSTTVSCPLCTNTACAVSPDDDQGQDGTNTPVRPPLMTMTGAPLCYPIQDAQKNSKDWICRCQKDIYSTSWSTCLLARSGTTSLISNACAYTKLPDAVLPATRTSTATCSLTNAPGIAVPLGAKATAIETAISSFCSHYSELNLVPGYAQGVYRGKGGPRVGQWDGQTRTKDYSFASPAAFNLREFLRNPKVVVVVRLSIKHQRQACDDPKQPVQSQFAKDNGDWCRNEMKKVVSQCKAFNLPYHGDFYMGGEVNAGCIQFGVKLESNARDEL